MAFLFSQLDKYCLIPCRRERFDEIGKKIKREGDVSSQMGRRQMLGPPGTLNTITPCAACKLLRRRCAQECPFSPYFSPHEPQKFASVHKVFGASNVSKMLMVLKPSLYIIYVYIPLVTNSKYIFLPHKFSLNCT